MTRLLFLGASTLALATSVTAPAHADALAACHLENNSISPWSSDGNCALRWHGNGDFDVTTHIAGQGKVYASVYVVSPHQVANGLWGYHGKPTGTLYANGPCWENALIRICAWKPGEMAMLPPSRFAGSAVATFAPPPAQVPAYVPPIAPTPSAATPAPSRTIGIEIAADGHSMLTRVRFGSATYVTAIIDTGATHIAMPASMLDQLVAKGEARYIGTGTTTIADGSQHEEVMCEIRDVQIGGVTLHNVKASTLPEGTDVLFGASALDQLGTLTIDKAHGRLLFG